MLKARHRICVPSWDASLQEGQVGPNNGRIAGVGLDVVCEDRVYGKVLRWEPREGAFVLGSHFARKESIYR